MIALSIVARQEAPANWHAQNSSSSSLLKIVLMQQCINLQRKLFLKLYTQETHVYVKRYSIASGAEIMANSIILLWRFSRIPTWARAMFPTRNGSRPNLHTLQNSLYLHNRMHALHFLAGSWLISFYKLSPNSFTGRLLEIVYLERWKSFVK